MAFSRTLALMLLLLAWRCPVLAEDNETVATPLDYLGVGNGTTSPEDYLDYDYDYDVSMNEYDWGEVASELVVYSLIMLLGLTGNVLIIFTTMRYRRMQSTTNVFLASLASADLLLIVVCIPVKLAKLMSFTWQQGHFMCKAVHYMQNVTAMCSVFTLTAMSIERYYAIIHPMKVKYMCTLSDTRKICASIWMAAFVLATPILWAIDHKQVGVKVKAYWCLRDYDPDMQWYLKLHDIYSLVVILILPTGIMVFTYTTICWEVWHVMLQRCQMTSGQGLGVPEGIPLAGARRSMRQSLNKGVDKTRMTEETQTVKQVTKMLVAVVVVFIFCWTPLLMDNLLTAFEVLPHAYRRNGSDVHYKYMSVFFHLLCYFNSCVNPIVYGFMSRSFRDSFQQALCRCQDKAANRQPSLHTKTTSIRLTERQKPKAKPERRKKLFVIC